MTEVSAIVKDMLFEEPYYGLYLCGLNKRWTEGISTAAVGVRGIDTELLINQEFWESLDSDDCRYALLQHELLHICFGHLLDNWKDQEPDHQLLNIAMDLTVESYIAEKRYLRVKGELQGAADRIFEAFNLPKCQGTRWYLKWLHSMKNQLNGGGSGDSKPDSNQSQSTDEQGNLQQNPSERAAEDMQNASAEAKQELKDLLNRDDHMHVTWSDFDKLSREEKEMARKQWEWQVKQASEGYKGCGNMPGWFVEKIEELTKLKPAVFNWRQYLRRILGTRQDILPRATRRKESKRFPDNMGMKYQKKHSILVAIDTSGSIGTQDFIDFFNELRHLYKAGAYIHILECDTGIAHEYDYAGHVPTEGIHGRGGTYFTPAVDYYNKHYHDYDSFVYFTDGYGDVEDCHPCRQMIWIITPNGDHTANYPGIKVFIP